MHSWFFDARYVPSENHKGHKLTTLDVEIFPAFGYGRDPHVTTLFQETHTSVDEKSKIATFHSKDVRLQLDVAIERGENEFSCPSIEFRKEMRPKMLGEGLVARVHIAEGQAISFVLRNDLENHITENITTLVLDAQQHDTQSFWYNFISQSKYKGRWREVVSRSLMILKMLTYGGCLTLTQMLMINSLTLNRTYWRNHSCTYLFRPGRRGRCSKLGLQILLGPRLELQHLHLVATGLQSRS